MKKKHTLEQLLKDLCDIHYEQGIHSGLWEDELNHESSANNYLEKMKMFADEYNIEYYDDVKDNFNPETWEEEFGDDMICYAEDELGFDLKVAVCTKILDEIFDYVKFNIKEVNI